MICDLGAHTLLYNAEVMNALIKCPRYAHNMLNIVIFNGECDDALERAAGRM